MLLRDYNPALRYGAKILPSEIVGGVDTWGRNVYYCMKSTDTYYQAFYDANYAVLSNGNGNIYNTITAAIAVARDNDIIYVFPGVWEEAGTITLAYTGMKLLGVQTSGHQWGQPSIHAHTTGTHACITINAGQCEVAYLGIHQQTAASGIRIGGSEAESGNTVWRTHIHDIYFGGNSTGTYGIVIGDTTVGGGAYGLTIDAPCTTVERCYFGFWATACAFFNAGYGSVIRDCVFQVNANSIGIKYYTDTTSRPFAFILDNRFTAVSNSTSTGISITNTPTAGYLMIDGNHFIVFGSDNLCISARTGYTALNYLGVTAIPIT